MTTKYKLGDTFWYVPDRKWELPREVTVTAVGRQWIHLSNSKRAHLVDLKVDGGEFSSPGTLYKSEAEYEDYRKRKSAWNDFLGVVERLRCCPQSMTIERIAKMTAMLGD